MPLSVRRLHRREPARNYVIELIRILGVRARTYEALCNALWILATDARHRWRKDTHPDCIRCGETLRYLSWMRLLNDCKEKNSGASGFPVGQRTASHPRLDATHAAAFPSFVRRGEGRSKPWGATWTRTADTSMRQPAETLPHLTSPYKGEAWEKTQAGRHQSTRCLAHSIF